ncbi:copper amine oxidase N-terminal domain-containing protein [Acetivibrio clariflavus]|uniref:copper amine oxidase N-terminal domain-containing protein n=1 Tax=Acetivibrio clariflavus TaxID=288965 RepID=UPI000486A2AD|nr:copper amine oxidase N-terminal domain-containing protein [Acetivibrio clariflavus]
MSSRKFLSILVTGLLAAMFVGVIMPSKVLAETSGKTVVLQVNSTTAIVNGKSVTLDVAPYIDESSGRTLVPLRFISESLGYIVEWDDEEKAVRICNKIDMNSIDSSEGSVEYFRSWSTYKYVKLTIGNNVAETCDDYIIGEYVYIEKEPLDQAPVIKDGRTMLPVRFISEQMGLNVEWDSKTQKITISSKGEGYVPEPIEAALEKVASKVFEFDAIYLNSKQPDEYSIYVRTDGFEYYIGLSVKRTYDSTIFYEQVLRGDIIGLKGDTACFAYSLTQQEEQEYRYDGTIKVTEEGFIVSYTNEQGEKCSITFPNK